MADFENVDDAAEELLKRWKVPADKDPAVPGVVKPPVAPVVEEEDEEEVLPGDDEDNEEEEVLGTLAEDDHEVEIEPGKRLKVAELKALAAKEAQISSKFDAASQAATKAAEDAQRHQTGLTTLLDRARQRWEPYSKVDFLVAQNELSKEEFAALRAHAASAYEDVKYLESELTTAVQTSTAKQREALTAAAQECQKVLSNPETGIPSWGPKVYNELHAYALETGIAKAVVDNLVDPAAFKVLHKAMLYDKAQKGAVKKVVTAPKNVNKNPTNRSGTTSGQSKVRSAMDTLRKTGDADAAAEALLARWSAKS